MRQWEYCIRRNRVRIFMISLGIIILASTGARTAISLLQSACRYSLLFPSILSMPLHGLEMVKNGIENDRLNCLIESTITYGGVRRGSGEFFSFLDENGCYCHCSGLALPSLSIPKSSQAVHGPNVVLLTFTRPDCPGFPLFPHRTSQNW